MLSRVFEGLGEVGRLVGWLVGMGVVVKLFQTQHGSPFATRNARENEAITTTPCLYDKVNSRYELCALTVSSRVRRIQYQNDKGRKMVMGSAWSVLPAYQMENRCSGN